MEANIESDILRLMIDKAPNWVSEITIQQRLRKYDQAALRKALQRLVDSERLEREIDPRAEFQSPMPYFKLRSLQGIPIRQTINIADVSVPRVHTATGVKYFPEDFNEAIEQLAEYSDTLEDRFAELVKQEQRKYWGNIVSLFGVFVAVLSLIIVGLPKIETDPMLPFWQVVLFNLAQLLPLAIILILFVLLLRLIFR